MFNSLSHRILQLPPLSPAVALLIRVIFLGMFNALLIPIALALFDEGNWFLAVAMILTLIVVTGINVIPKMAPLRWMTISLGIIILVAVYPLIFTFYVSFTNYSDGHRFTKEEALSAMQKDQYLPEGAINYYWSPYVSPGGEYALWLVSAEDGSTYFAMPGKPLERVEPGESGEGPYTEGERLFPDGLPAIINGYQIAEGPAFFKAMQDLDRQSGAMKNLRFGDANNLVGISGRSEAGNYQPRWIYDAGADTLTDKATYVTYKGNVDKGQFIAADGSVAPYDYKVPYDSNDKRRNKPDALALYAKEKYLAENSVNYAWTVYQNEAGDYALLLVSDGGTFFAVPDQPLRPMEAVATPPATIDDYKMLNSGATMQALSSPGFRDTNFSDTLTPIYVNELGQAGNYRPRWLYNPETDILTDLTQNVVYHADDEIGEYVAADGSEAPLGYWVVTGIANYRHLIESSLLDGPLLTIILWTVTFASMSVFTAFAVGMLMALVLQDDFKGIRIIRSLLIVPWAIPGMIGILIWRGMLNGRVGVIPATLVDLFGITPKFLTDPTWAKISILVVNLWLAYPYFMLITSGALQSIPKSIYEAAEVDGASTWQKFRDLTLPLLLVSMGPLLIASFIFNFNNYLLIEALTGGGPQIQGTNAPPVGYTDNLMTYTYRYAFASGGTRNFGLASAIAVAIFIVVGMMTLLQFRLTKRWEEIGENV